MSATLTNQEQRLFDAMRAGWADAEAMQEAAQGATPFNVILSKLKHKLPKLGYALEIEGGTYERIGKKKWRVVELSKEMAA